MFKKWQIAQKISKDFQNQFPEINPLVLQILYNRGLKTQEEIDEFLNPDYGQDLHDPFLFKDMKKAVKRIFKALEKGERMVVHGDYDADGVTGACLLVLTLRELDCRNIDVYIPHRESEGYGLNKNSITEMAKKGTNLIITVDSGISNYEEIELANKLGMDVIITDHHHEPPKLPKAYAIINPQVARENYPFRNLAGVGVAFKLAQTLLKHKTQNTKHKSIIENNQAFEKWLLDLVAVGTVADMMPLLGENRTLVKYGLIVLNKTRRIGLQELIKVSDLVLNTNHQLQPKKLQTTPASLCEAGRASYKIDTWNIGFQIGPRINAAGRLDHANKAYQLLITEDKEGAKKIAQELNEINRGRQEMIRKIVEEAKAQIGEVTSDQKILFVTDPKIAVNHSEGVRNLSDQSSRWPIGIIGLIAGQLSDKFYRPTLVITKHKDNFKACGRSIPEFNLIKAIEQAGKYLLRFGGHAGAAGFSIDPKNLDKFKKKMEEIAEQKLADVELMLSYSAEKEVNLNEINWEFYQNLERFAPFGQENPRPKFVARDLMVIGLEKVGQKGKHLRLIVKDHTNSGADKGEEIRKMIYFDGGEKWGEKLRMGDRVDSLFEVSVNQWNGQRELQLKVIDLHKVG